ncbi:hypothetical protein GA0115249_102921 [Streptomyces sp. PpalLS-921]|nr:hypothetical protein GA0115249_102921 [Streptomyces sp. PpalLS-921]
MRSPEASRTARTRPAVCSSRVTSADQRSRAPASAAASAMARGSACIPPLGNQTPATVSMYAITA